MKTRLPFALTLIFVMLAVIGRAEVPTQSVGPSSESRPPVTTGMQDGAAGPLATTEAAISQNIENALAGRWNHTIYTQVFGQGAQSVWDSVRGLVMDVPNPTSMGSCVEAGEGRGQVIQRVLQNMSRNGELPYNATVFNRSGYNFPIPFTDETGSAHTYNVIELTDDTGRIVSSISVDDYLGWTSVSPGQDPVNRTDNLTAELGTIPMSSNDPNAPFRANNDRRANEPAGGVRLGSGEYVSGSKPGETAGMTTTLPGWAGTGGPSAGSPPGDGSQPPLNPLLTPYLPPGAGWENQPPFVGIGLPPLLPPLTPWVPGGHGGGGHGHSGKGSHHHH